MAVFTRIKTWVSNEVLTASDLNGEFNNLLTNTKPESIEDQSTDVATMQATVDPGGSGTESLATTLAGEIQRLRYKIKQIIGGPYWYSTPVLDLFSTIATADITDLAVTTAKIDDLAITSGKLGADSVINGKISPLAISALTNLTLVDAADEFLIRDNSASDLKKISFASIFAGILTASPKSLVGNGYMQLGDTGAPVIQWGSVTIGPNSGDSIAITFPIAFTSGLLFSTAFFRATPTVASSLHQTAGSISGFTIARLNDAAAAGPGTVAVSWFAVGY